MKELNATELRTLIGMIQPLRMLRDDVEQCLHLELYHGASQMMAQTFRGLRDQVYGITQDNILTTLEIMEDDELEDRERASQVFIAAGQLLAYVENATGAASMGKERRHFQVQTAPNIDLNIGDVIGGQMDRVMDMVNDALHGIHPSHPPKSSQPPHAPHAPHARKIKKRIMRGFPGMHEGFDPRDEDDSTV